MVRDLTLVVLEGKRGRPEHISQTGRSRIAAAQRLRRDLILLI